MTLSMTASAVIVAVVFSIVLFVMGLLIIAVIIMMVITVAEGKVQDEGKTAVIARMAVAVTRVIRTAVSFHDHDLVIRARVVTALQVFIHHLTHLGAAGVGAFKVDNLP